jgi:hypothetical protein
MLYQYIIAFCLTLFMVNVILNLRALHRLGDEKEELPESLPLISILIPARDEESQIARYTYNGTVMPMFVQW